MLTRSFDASTVSEIFRREAAGEDLSTLTAEYGFSSAQFLVWKGRYMQNKVNGKEPNTHLRRRGYVDTRNYYLSAAPHQVNTPTIHPPSATFTITGKNGQQIFVTKSQAEAEVSVSNPSDGTIAKLR